LSNGKLTLDDILNEYSADKATGGGERISSVYGYSSSEMDSVVKEIAADADEKRRKDDEIKKCKQIDYEIMSGDYERKYMPQELKTSEEIALEDGAADMRRRSGDELFNSLINDDYAKAQKEAQKVKTPKPRRGDTEKPSVSDEEKETSVSEKKKTKTKKEKNSFGRGILESIREKQVNDQTEQDEFERKYGTPDAPLLTIDNLSEDDLLGDGNEHKLPFEPAPKEYRSLSEKLAHEDEYKKKYSDTVKKDATKAVKVHKVKPTPRQSEKPAETPNPFGKYAAADVESILAEYDSAGKQPIRTVKSDTSPLKGFTDIFNKLMAKQESDDAQGGELLQGGGNIKHHGSTNTGTVPIERATISDIDLNLSDKIIQDTASVRLKKAELNKINTLKERRSEKVKNFYLVGDEQENSTEEEERNADSEEIDEYKNPTDSSSISEHIASQKGKLIIRLLAQAVCFALTIFIAMANDGSWGILDSLAIFDRRTQPDVVLFINVIIGAMAGVASYQTLANGMGKLLSGKADSDSLPAFALVLSELATLVTAANTNMLRGGFAYIYVPIAIGSLMFNTIGKLLIISRTERSFRFVSDDNRRYALFMVEGEADAQDFTRGALTDFPALGAMQKTELIADFLKTSFAPNSTDRFCKIVTPIVCIASVIIGIAAAIMARAEHGNLGALCAGFSAASCCAALCSCFSMMIIATLPMERASKKYSSDGGAIIGFDCIDEFADTNSILADASQLFPSGSVQLVNIKAFPDTSIDEAIVEAASLTSQSGSVLKSMFYDIIVGKTEMLNPVESYIYEDSLGLCGWINNKRVLLGGRELMVNHSIEGLPSPAKEAEYTVGNRMAVYLSISGQLSAMFVVEINPEYRVTEALHELQRSHISVMLRTVDSFLTVNRLAELFGVTPSLFRLLPFRMHSRFEKLTEYTLQRKATLACTGKFTAYSGLIVVMNRLRSTISAGLILMAAEILLGVLLTLTMTLLGALEELTVTTVFVYNAAFLLAYCLLQFFKRL